MPAKRNLTNVEYEEWRSLSCDEFCEKLLASGKYDVDIESGIVMSRANNKQLKSIVNASGYHVVAFVVTRTLRRQAKVHRLVAIKYYGLEKVKGLHVAHLDSNKLNNHYSNLRPMSAQDHVRYDKTWKNLRPTAPSTDPIISCANCEEKEGTQGIHRPQRISGKRFGINGQICRRCYGMLQERERRLKQGASTGNRIGRRVIDKK